MKIPKTTVEKPYIEFRVDLKGNIKLSASSAWYGGKRSGFYSSDGARGNTCPPELLNEYIQAFKEKEVKTIEKLITTLQKRLEVVKSKFNL